MEQVVCVCLQRKGLNIGMFVQDLASFGPKSVIKNFSLARTELGAPKQTECFQRLLQASGK